MIAFVGVMITADSAVDPRHRVVYHHRQYDAALNDDCEDDDDGHLDLMVHAWRSMSDWELIYRHQTVAMTSGSCGWKKWENC